MIHQLGEKFLEMRLVHAEVGVNINTAAAGYNHLDFSTLLFAYRTCLAYLQTLVEYSSV